MAQCCHLLLRTPLHTAVFLVYILCSESTFCAICPTCANTSPKRRHNKHMPHAPLHPSILHLLSSLRMPPSSFNVALTFSMGLTKVTFNHRPVYVIPPPPATIAPSDRRQSEFGGTPQKRQHIRWPDGLVRCDARAAPQSHSRRAPAVRRSPTDYTTLMSGGRSCVLRGTRL